MTEKIIGYILLVAGVLMIVVPVFNVYSVYTGKAQPIEPLKLKGVSLDLSSATGGQIPASPELLSSEQLNEPLNLVSHLLLMGFIASAGFRIAKLGTMLVRPIKVALKEAPKAPNA